jgi:hypothetical protein
MSAPESFGGSRKDTAVVQLGQLELIAKKMGLEPQDGPMPPMFLHKEYQESLLGCNRVWYPLLST